MSRRQWEPVLLAIYGRHPMAKPKSKAGLVPRKEPEVRQLGGMAVTKPGGEEEAYRQAIKRRQSEIRRKVTKET